MLKTCSFLEQDIAEITTSTSRTRPRKIIIHPKIRRQAWYLSGYLSGEGFERYHFSGGWVFSGWIGFSQWFKKEFGIYPPREMLVELGKMSKAEREEHTWFGLYLLEKEKIREGQNPSSAVVDKLNQSGLAYYRTDQHYHITFETDVQQV